MNFAMRAAIHDRNLSPLEAMAEQSVLAARVREENDFGAVQFIAGVDVGFEEGYTTARAAVVVMSFPELALVETAIALRPVTFPYIPGLLAYREVPVVLDAFEKLEHAPDLLIVDGQGRAHPRRFGIACHLGVLLELSSIGCAKSILVGRASVPENRAGAWTPLIDKGEIVGAALRTKVSTGRRVNPVYVSVGHRVDLETAIDFVLKCCRGYRLPETSRYAHTAASSKG